MDFHQATNRIFFIFFLLGHCKKQTTSTNFHNYHDNVAIIGECTLKYEKSKSYNTVLKPTYKIADFLRRMSQYIPLLLLIALNITMTLAALVYTPRSKGKFSESNHTVAHIFVASSFVTISTVIIQHLMNGDLVRDIRQHMNYVETLVEDKLQMPICFRKVRNLFFLKIALMVGTYAQAIAMFFVGSLVLKKFTICPLAYGLSVITDTSCLYAIFCIDFVHKTLMEINLVLKRYDRQLRERPDVLLGEACESKEVTSTRIVEKIEVLKQMYLSAWILTQKINRTFGWFFIAYLVQQFVDLAADLFWLFLINHDDFTYKIVCKYSMSVCVYNI